MDELAIDKSLFFVSVPDSTGIGFAFILFPDFVILPRNPKPNPFKASGHSLRTLNGFLLPAFFLLQL